MSAPLRTRLRPAFPAAQMHPSALKTSATAEARTKKAHFCRPLPTLFRHEGFDYQQIHREEDFAIYQQTWNGKAHSPAFEVIRIRRHDGFHIDGRFVEPGEIYPKPGAWGTDGWTVQDEVAAFRKLRQLARKG